MVVIDRTHLREIYKADEDYMHFLEAAVEDSDFSWAFRADVFQRVHSRAIRVNLNHNLPVFISDVVDEVNVAVKQLFPIEEDSTVCFAYHADSSMDTRRSIRKDIDSCGTTNLSYVCGFAVMYILFLVPMANQRS